MAWEIPLTAGAVALAAAIIYANAPAIMHRLALLRDRWLAWRLRRYKR